MEIIELKITITEVAIVKTVQNRICKIEDKVIKYITYEYSG